MQIPVACPVCGIVFPSILFDFNVDQPRGGAKVTFQGTRETCPNGHLAPIADGTYEAYDGAIHAELTGPGANFLISRLTQFAKTIERGETVSDNDFDELIDALPAEARAAIRFIARKSRALALTILFLIYLRKGLYGIGAVAGGIGLLGTATQEVSPSTFNIENPIVFGDIIVNPGEATPKAPKANKSVPSPKAEKKKVKPKKASPKRQSDKTTIEAERRFREDRKRKAPIKSKD